jgi:hypothetical protein
VVVSTALWLLAAALGAAVIALTLIDLDHVRASVLADVTQQFPDETAATRDRVLTAVLTVMVGGGTVILLLQLGFALAMRSRRRWARIALVPVGLAGVGHALITVGAIAGPLLAGAVAAVAVAATVTMFLPASNLWFTAHSGWGGRR